MCERERERETPFIGLLCQLLWTFKCYLISDFQCFCFWFPLENETHITTHTGTQYLDVYIYSNTFVKTGSMCAIVETNWTERNQTLAAIFTSFDCTSMYKRMHVRRTHSLISTRQSMKWPIHRRKKFIFQREFILVSNLLLKWKTGIEMKSINKEMPANVALHLLICTTAIKQRS